MRKKTPPPKQCHFFIGLPFFQDEGKQAAERATEDGKPEGRRGNPAAYRALPAGAEDGERESREAEGGAPAGSPGRAMADLRRVQVQLSLPCLQEHVANRDGVRATEEQQQKAEEERRKLFLTAKDKMMKLRKDREMELFRSNPARHGQQLHQLQSFHSDFFF